jgi:hypothetical protein
MAAAVGTRLVVYLEDAPGSDRPRDYQHAVRQDLVIRYAAAGDWSADPERLVAGPGAWRYVDVLLRRMRTRELAVVEVWDFIDDVGAGLRGLADKVERIRGLDPGWSVSGLLVVRATQQNRRLVTQLSAIFATNLPASSRAWLRALSEPEGRMPAGRGLVWSDVRGTRLFASNLSRRQRVALSHSAP